MVRSTVTAFDLDTMTRKQSVDGKNVVRTHRGYRIDWGDTIVFSPYTPFHHMQRKLYHQSFGKHVVSEYWPVQEREANILLKGLQDHPKKFDKQVERCVNRCLFELTTF